MVMFAEFRLSMLPGYMKLFVGTVTGLLMGVVLWAVFIYYVDKGIIAEHEVPDYYYDSEQAGAADPLSETTPAYDPSSPEAEADRQSDIAALSDDPDAALAPIWDSSLAGQPARVDSATMAQKFREGDEYLAGEAREFTGSDARDDPAELYSDSRPDWQTQLRRNVGLAHTHINGQTLLYAVLGLFFVFTSATVKLKKILLWSFTIVILLHSIGLSGESFHWFFDDILAVSGVAMLAIMSYMAFLVFVELGRKPKDISNHE